MSLIGGVAIGLSALANNSGFVLDPSLASDVLFHPDLMIFGVLGGLLVTEKLAGMEQFKIFYVFRISRLTLLFLYCGVLFVSIGILYSTPIIRYVGLVSVITASVLFLTYVISPRSHGKGEIKWIFGAGISAITLTSLANFTLDIPQSVQLTYLSLLFPTIYILAERIELGFIRGMKRNILATESVLSWLTVALGFISVESPLDSTRSPIMFASIFFLSVIVMISIRFDPVFRKVAVKGRFEMYMKTGIVIAYSWLVIGIVLFSIRLFGVTGLLDPATHSFALGFFGTFIVTHSPIIFPLVLKRDVMRDRVTLLPIISITVADVMRVFGDLASRVSTTWNVVSYISGYAIIVAIIAFVYNIFRVTSHVPPDVP